MVRQAALTMTSFDEEGVMPAMVFFLRHLVAHIRQYVILMGADRVCMWGPSSQVLTVKRQHLAAAAYQSTWTTIFETGGGALSSVVVNSAAAPFSKHEFMNYRFQTLFKQRVIQFKLHRQSTQNRKTITNHSKPQKTITNHFCI